MEHIIEFVTHFLLDIIKHFPACFLACVLSHLLLEKRSHGKKQEIRNITLVKGTDTTKYPAHLMLPKFGQEISYDGISGEVASIVDDIDRKVRNIVIVLK